MAPTDLPNKFEPGTPSIEAVVGLNASLEYLNKINFYSYFEEENKMRNTLIERLKDIPSIQIYGIEKQINASSIVSFNIIDKNYNDISTFLLLIGNECGAHTVPYIESSNSDSMVEHEATTSKINEEHAFDQNLLTRRYPKLNTDQMYPVDMVPYCNRLAKKMGTYPSLKKLKSLHTDYN